MRNMCLGITAFVVTVGMVSVGAQGRNFSGTWVVDSEKTAAAAQAAAASGETGGAVMTRSTAGGGGGRAVGGVVAGGGGGGSTAPTAARSAGGGGEARVMAGGGGGGAVIAGGGGGRGGAVVNTDLVITMDGSNFTMDQSGIHTSFPTNGTETTILLRGTTEAKVKASWKGDTLLVEQTIDTPNGPVASATSWFLEGDSLVRLTSRRTYYKKK